MAADHQWRLITLHDTGDAERGTDPCQSPVGSGWRRMSLSHSPGRTVERSSLTCLFLCKSTSAAPLLFIVTSTNRALGIQGRTVVTSAAWIWIEN